MTKPSLAFILSLGLAFGCARDDVAGPQANIPANRVFTKLEITPGNIVLLPDSTSQLTVKALDQFGEPMQADPDGNGNINWASRTSYWNEDPQIVEVNSRGVVKGIAPGRARVRISLTIAGQTLEAVATPTVSGPISFPVCVYDLSAPISGFDPIWWDFTGYRYTAVITITPGGSGTVQNFRLIDSNGDLSASIGDGVISSYTDLAGRIVNELVAGNFHFSMSAPIQDPSDSQRVTGTWGCCGHISGTFSARRRQ